MNTDKLFLGCGGDLTLVQEGFRVLRPKYSYHFREITNSLQLRATIRAGEFTWPGGYQLYFVMSDGEAMCFKCARKEYFNLAHSMRHNIRDDWRVIGCDTNDEDPELYCDHCNTRIPSNYGED